MEPQINVNCCRRREHRKCCIDLVLGILLLALSFIVGVIIGALTGLVTFLGIGAIVVLTVILLLLIVIRLIMLACENRKNCCS